MASLVAFKKILLILALSSLALKSNSQINGYTNLSGAVVDSLSNPIEYCAVQIFSKMDSSISYGAISQIDGTFTIRKVPLNVYTIKYSAIGYKSFSSTLDLSDVKRNTHIGYISLKEDVFEMDEVVIYSTRKGVSERVDKMVYVPDSTTLSTARTGIDVIRRLPEIRFDNKDRTLSVLGNKNILVLINGIDHNRTLESIHPEDIDRIEVITHPSVKYQSDIASVINIILKGPKEKGTTIISNTYYCINKKNHSGNLQVDHQIGRLGLFIRYFGNFAETESLDSTLRKDLIEGSTIEHRINSIPGNIADAMQNMIQYCFDFEFDKRNLLSFTSRFLSQGYESDRKRDMKSIIYNYPFQESSIESLFNTSKNEQNHSILFKHKFNDDRKSITFNTNYYNLQGESDFLVKDSLIKYSTTIPSVSNKIKQTHTLDDQCSFNSRLDFQWPINSLTDFESGYQLYNRYIKSINKTNYSNVSDLFYNEMRNSLYSKFTYNLARMGFQAGIRCENFNSSVLGSNYNKTILLPYGAILFKPKPIHSLNIYYRKSLEYPSYSYLNPLKIYSADSLSFSSGNPFLRPQETTTVNFKYSFNKKDTYLSSSFYYNYVNNIITQKATLDNGLIAYKYENQGKALQYGVNISFMSVLFDWLEVEMLMRGYFTDYPSRKMYNGFSYAAEFGFVAPLWADFDLEVFGVVGEKEYDYNGYSRHYGYIDEISITKSIINNLHIGFSVWQPFIKVQDKYKQWGDTFSETSIYTEVNSTSYIFNITYFFRSGKGIKKNDTDTIMEENLEKGRRERR